MQIGLGSGEGVDGEGWVVRTYILLLLQRINSKISFLIFTVFSYTRPFYLRDLRKVQDPWFLTLEYFNLNNPRSSIGIYIFNWRIFPFRQFITSHISTIDQNSEKPVIYGYSDVSAE